MQYLAEGHNPLKGDLLIIFGSMLYACSNVAEVTSNPGHTKHFSLFCFTIASQIYLITCLLLALSFLPNISGVSGQEEQQD
jgi:hypothetical protein